MNTIKRQLHNFNWQSLVITIVAQIISWWSIPIIYSSHLATASFRQTEWFLLLYSLMIAISVYLLLTTRFTSRLSLITLIASFILALSGVVTGTVSILLMLILLPSFLTLIQFRYAKLQNEFGLVIYAVLSAFIIPEAAFSFQNKFLSWTFINQLWPLFFSFIFLLTPALIKYRSQPYILMSLIGAIGMIVSLLPGKINLTTILSIVLIIVLWVGMQLLPRLRNPFVVYSAIQALLILLVTL